MDTQLLKDPDQPVTDEFQQADLKDAFTVLGYKGSVYFVWLKFKRLATRRSRDKFLPPISVDLWEK